MADVKRLPLHKIIMLGSGGVGKSALTLQYMYKEFVDDYEPTKADCYRTTVTLEGHAVSADILDTAGQEEYPTIRDTYINSGEGYMLVFSLSEHESFTALTDFREQILRVKATEPNIPILLIGNKADLAIPDRVPSGEAQQLAHSWNIPYMETSAKTNFNVDEAFYQMLLQIDHYKKAKLEEKGQKTKKKPKKLRMKKIKNACRIH